jgi:transmembrane sensor
MLHDMNASFSSNEAAQIAHWMHQKMQGVLSVEDSRKLESWLEKQSVSLQLQLTEMQTDQALFEALRQMQAYDEKEAYREVLMQLDTNSPKKASVYKLSWLRYAAAIVILALATTFWIQKDSWFSSTHSEWAGRYDEDVLPGTDRAILQLDNGEKIILDEIHKGAIVKQGQAQVVKSDTGIIKYNVLAVPNTKQIAYNKIIIPRGGKHQVVLPDGTKVYLNAASSLRFPTAFTGSERKVELTGEAYFEVSTDASKPFIIVANKQEVRVLGTSFNIQAYEDEPLHQTTLISGSIQVEAFNKQILLKPGQAAQLINQKELKLTNADVSRALAWKSDLIWLEDYTIESVMRQIARWYDVDIQYEGKITQQFSGKIPRNMNLSDVLKVLESTGWVQFEIRNKTVIVKP